MRISLTRWLAALLTVAPVAAWAWADEPLPELIATRQAAFVIPFQIDEGDGGTGEPAEVELHVSRDGGQTWSKHERLPAGERGFRFRAMRDGEYCFALRTWDAQGVVRPVGRLTPELRVLVDTVPPTLELSAERDPAGEVAVRLQLSDADLLPDSLTLEYRPQGSSAPWQTVEFDPLPADAGDAPHAGQIWFVPNTSARNLDLRAEVRDRAGNPTVTGFALVERRSPVLEDGTTAPRLSPARTDDVGDVVGSDDWRPRQPTPWPADQTSEAPVTAPRRVARSVSSGERRAVAPLDRNDLNHQAESAAEVPVRTAPRERSAIPVRRAGLEEREPISPDGEALPDSGDVREAAPINDETSGETAGAAIEARGASVSSGLAAAAPPGVRPRMVNSTRFRLDYDVEAVGPWGVRKVELWGTRDGGRSWELYGTDDDNQTPLTVTVPEEGMYGFRVLVQSGSGLAEPPPRGGEPPEIWLGVDLTRPTGHIAAVEPGSGERAGQLIVHWEADDAQPSERPISLYFGEKPNGPWTPVATGLRNSGRYVWQLEQSVPDRVYLRLEVRDEAGNATVFDLPDAVTVAPLRPRGRILNVQPLEETRLPPRVYRF